jgi:hypothetical protein
VVLSVKKKSVKNNSDEDLRPEAGGSARKTQVRFKNLGDVRRFMARVLNDLDADIITEVKARTLGYLCSVLRDVIKDSDLEARVSRLEREIENGNNGETR